MRNREVMPLFFDLQSFFCQTPIRYLRRSGKLTNCQGVQEVRSFLPSIAEQSGSILSEEEHS
jgi:hypothetical protein